MGVLQSLTGFVAITCVVVGCSSSSTDDGASNDPSVVGGDASTGDAANGQATGTTPTRCSAPPCANGELCAAPGDCTSGICTDTVCRSITSTDGTKDGNETDVDCGGEPATETPRCATGKTCAMTADCNAVLCTGNVCAVPASNDGLKNGTESGVDCGGAAPTNAARCAVGATCSATSDCDGVLCTGGVCQPASHGDGIENGNETGIDCGGPDASKCKVGGGCASNGDCDALKCAGGTCQPASSGDGVKNGTETDIDCGGGAPTNASACAVDLKCSAHSDCASSACAASGPKAGLCVAFKSCVGNYSTYACGRNDAEVGLGGNTSTPESCCSPAPLAGSTVKLDRFAITAGRMREFITRLAGNVRGYVQAPATKPAGWNPTGAAVSWDLLVPSTVAEAEVMLGDYWLGAPNDNPNLGDEKEISKRSCGNDNYNGHTYYAAREWVDHKKADPQVYTQAQLDPKLLNCVGWHLVKALCAWDGGHLATRAELRNAFTNNGTTTWPWEFATGAYRLPALSNNVLVEGNSAQDDRLNHHYIYGFPGDEPASARITWWISPPGRFYKGWNANKIELAGNALEWTGDYEYNFVWQESFENHNGKEDDGGDWRTPGDPNDRGDVPNGYYALGARCAYP